MDTLLTNAHIFVNDGTGTLDAIPGDDNALGRLWPGRFAVAGKFPGLASAQIAAALPTPDTFVALSLAWTQGGVRHTHFLPVVGGKPGDFLVGDSWDAVTKHLNSSYGVASVVGTILVKALTTPAKEAAAAAAKVAQAAAQAAALAKAKADAADAAAKAAAQAAAEKAAAEAAAAAQASQEAANAVPATPGPITPSPTFLERLVAYVLHLFGVSGGA